jgi:hypothetical protein
MPGYSGPTVQDFEAFMSAMIVAAILIGVGGLGFWLTYYLERK